MSQSNITDHKTQGTVILDRFKEITVPALLKPLLATYTTEHRAYTKAAGKVDVAEKARDKALEELAKADVFLDSDVEDLASSMAGAQLGPRANPFKKFSSHSPSELKGLRYATEVSAVRDLVAAVLAASPPAAVVAVTAKALKHADQVEDRLQAITAPQAAYDKALSARDALLPGLTRALAKLKAQAKATWMDEPGTFAAMFAPPERVQRPRARRKPRSAPASPPEAPK
jgi:hypothetical protein